MKFVGIESKINLKLGFDQMILLSDSELAINIALFAMDLKITQYSNKLTSKEIIFFQEEFSDKMFWHIKAMKIIGMVSPFILTLSLQIMLIDYNYMQYLCYSIIFIP